MSRDSLYITWKNIPSGGQKSVKEAQNTASSCKKCDVPLCAPWTVESDTVHSVILCACDAMSCFCVDLQSFTSQRCLYIHKLLNKVYRVNASYSHECADSLISQCMQGRIPGFPVGGGANPPGGAYIPFCQKFRKIAWNWENFGP